jgi:hypothetical protein
MDMALTRGSVKECLAALHSCIMLMTTLLALTLTLLLVTLSTTMNLTMQALVVMPVQTGQQQQ